MAQDVVNILVLAAVYLLFALGMSLAWGTIGILNFAHGSVFMFSAFVDYLIVRDMELPILPMILVGMAVGAALSVAAQVLAFEPIVKRAKDVHAASLQILIAGIGIAIIPLAIAQKVTLNTPFGFSGSSFRIDTFAWGGDVRISNAQLLIIACGVVFGGGTALWLRKSRSGLALRSIGVDAETASMMGINRRALAIGAMALAGALAGLAGVLLTYNLGAIAPQTGDALLLKAFAATVLGGVGSIAGVMAGATILAIAETLVLTHTSGTWVDAVSFGLIFIVLLLRPQGLLGRREVRRT
ncbi:branched-chain amino acid ABC transporter permease [Dactylosporangium sp. CA-233914]|uniref:branched-chain amino acid ABC transporter permease n=1 Tax=Dactylosporangium sp. CA-233914 TaxID=3239934 RepID=UPI003D91196F